MNSKKQRSPLVQAMYDAEVVKGEADHSLILACPFEKDGDQHTARYILPQDPCDPGKFICEHCPDKVVDDLLVKWKLAPSDARACQRITLDKLFANSDAACAVLIELGLFFVIEGKLVRVDPETGHCSRMTEEELAYVLSKNAIWLRKNGKETDVPRTTVKNVLHRKQYPELSELAGVSHQPILQGDGRLLLDPGYDKATGLYAAFSAEVYRPLAWQTVSKAEALDAVKRIEKEVLSEFTFASQVDKSAAVAALLMSVLRQQMSQAPMLFVSADQSGSGKSYFSMLCGVLAQAGIPPAATKPRDEGELVRSLISKLSQRPEVVIFDNVKKISDDGPICSILSMPKAEARGVQTNRQIVVSTRSLVILNGNIRKTPGDFRRRTLSVWLSGDPLVALRTFKNPHLIETVLETRPQLVCDLLKLPAAYMMAGRPSVEYTDIVGYTDWTHLVREPLIWIGLPDPAGRTIQQVSEVDPAEVPWLRLVEALAAAFGDRPFTVAGVMQRFETFAPALGLLGISGSSDSAKKIFGKALKKRIGVPIGKYVILARDTARPSYRLEVFVPHHIEEE